jgi:hypothetical protein
MSGVPSSPLSEIFGSSSSADLIVFLVYNHGIEFTVQDMAERTKISKPKISKMMKGLLKYSIAHETRKVGKVSLYKYDRNSKFGKLLYELVFTAGSQERAAAAGAATATPTSRNHKGKDDEGGKIIFA